MLDPGAEYWMKWVSLLTLMVVAGCGGGSSVTAPPPPPPPPSPAPVATVTLNQNAAMLSPGATVTLAATTRDGAGNTLTGRSVTWLSNADAVATVTSGGTVTAIAPGAATITATSEGKSASAAITVAATVVPVASVTLNQSSATLVTGQPLTLVATPLDANGVALTGRGISWSSSATSVASVDANGVVTALAAGTATLTATSETRSASAVITVNSGGFITPAGGSATAFAGNASVTVPAGALSNSVALTIAQVASPQPDPKLVPGTAFDFGPTGTTFTIPVTLNIKYDAATLAAGTNQAQLRVHKLIGTTWTPLIGSTVNTATHVVSGATSSFSTYAVLEVVIPVAVVAIAPNPVDLPLGMQVQLNATTTDAQSNVLLGRAVTWTSSAMGVATIVPGTGLVTSVATGTTTITATSEGISTQMTLNVRTDPSQRVIAADKGADGTWVGFGFQGVASVPAATCAIGSNQRGYCWGYNNTGQLGDGTTVDKAVATPIQLANALVAVTVGAGFGCALDTSKNAWCWGSNKYGQFGNGASATTSNVPVAAGSGRQFIDIAAGESFVCGIDIAGGTYCWGRNDLGSTGTGSTVPAIVSVPTRIPNDPGLVSLSAGGYVTCGLTVGGAAWCWGSGQSVGVQPFRPTLVAGGPAFTRLSRGAMHTCGLTMDRKLYCWGENSGGELGDGTLADRTVPGLVSGTMTWRYVSAGLGYTCAITTDNRNFCWGLNTPHVLGANWTIDGQLGIGTLAPATTPQQVGSSAPPFAALVAGTSQTCGITASGAGYCFGLRGLLGDGDYGYSSGPTPVVNGTNATIVARGSPLGCFIGANKLLQCWGSDENATSAAVVFGGIPARAVVSIGGFNGVPTTCFISDPGAQIFCWGYNHDGNLGNGSTVDAATPTPLASNRTFTSVGLGRFGGCGVSTQSELICWGNDGVAATAATPIQVQSGQSWAFVSGSDGGAVCAITTLGAAYCGGAPTQLALIPGTQHWIQMVTAGPLGGVACGVTDSNDAYCKGTNTYGELGDGTTVTRSTLAPVNGGIKFTRIEIAVNDWRSVCGLAVGGSVYCWGLDEMGMLGGPASHQPKTAPTLLPGGYQFTTLSASFSGFCGVATTGSVICWGPRASSALGNGARDDELLPVAMTPVTRFLLYEPGSAALRAQLRRP